MKMNDFMSDNKMFQRLMTLTMILQAACFKMALSAVNIQKAAQQAFSLLRIGCFSCQSRPVGVRVSGSILLPTAYVAQALETHVLTHSQATYAIVNYGRQNNCSVGVCQYIIYRLHDIKYLTVKVSLSSLSVLV